MKIFSFSPFGYEGSLVTVEVDLRRGIPAIDIVGLADGAVKESRERMQAAIRNSDFDFPPERVLISLSPADLKKEGAGFDLPIALAVLSAKSEFDSSNKNPGYLDEDILIMGELELSGKIRPVKGIHAAVSTAKSFGIRKCIVPVQNANEAREVPGVGVFGAETLKDAFSALTRPEIFSTLGESNISNTNYMPEGAEEINGVLFSALTPELDFETVQGQEELIRCLQIAAAGGHNFLAVGAPGCGKTMSMQKFPSINPILQMDEAQSVTRIWSLAGLIKPSEPLVRIPPFRMPHQTATTEGICGGGINCRPGEISLAHNGILFLDEAAEFKTSVLQMLRVPLESGSITLSRAGRSTVYPARFQLFMAANPCPCGNYGSKTKLCLCSARSIEQYWKKFSAPLLDRIDLRVYIENNSEVKKERTRLKTTREIRQGIANAVINQRLRQNKKNANLQPQEIVEYCKIDEDSKLILDAAINRYGFSPRAISSCLKVARTIADIENNKKIEPVHVKEAIEYRKLCTNLTPEL